MSLLRKIVDSVKAVNDVFTTPDSFRAGEDFENYTREFIFHQSYYILTERTHSYKTNQDYVLSSLKPDFTFTDKITKKDFYLECKYRSYINDDNTLQWCNDDQLKRYSELNKQKPVFVLIGLGGIPGDPELLSLIRLDKFRYSKLFLSVLEKHSLHLKKPIPSKILWNR